MIFNFCRVDAHVSELKKYSAQLTAECENLGSIINELSKQDSKQLEEICLGLKRKKEELFSEAVKMNSLAKSLEKITLLYQRAENKNISLANAPQSGISFFEIRIPQWVYSLFE